MTTPPVEERADDLQCSLRLGGHGLDRDPSVEGEPLDEEDAEAEEEEEHPGFEGEVELGGADLFFDVDVAEGELFGRGNV